ncbi:APC family permease [uncultured Jatrophihabitans sp.]|uniref:APC family permease n=1 Tax=uncultured Jatrophihabitans sp. TaxID=1610747 RepID=UPI0035CB29E0
MATRIPTRPAGARRTGQDRDDSHKLTAVGGLAALSLDALSSVAYGPEAVVIALTAAGAAAVRLTLPISIAIALLLIVLVVSYRQVIAVHPDGGGAYAVAKTSLGQRTSLLAAASLVVDYVLTVAVSLAAGAASLASVFPSLADHLLAVALVGLLVLTLLNLVGIAESARALMLPTAVFVVAILATIVVGLVRHDPVAVVGHDLGPIEPTEALGIVLVLKAFAAGCSALTGVEAIANGVPAFRAPAVKRAQRTELALGVLLGVMLVGLAVAIKIHHIVPRGDVTVLAQLSAGAFGTGWPFYVTNLAVTLVLAFAANTSFGGLPVLMSLLARDNRLPHLFGLRAERPVFRYGVSALALLSAVLLLVVGADTNQLLPLFAIGVFIGFTISQVGLVRHWRQTRSAGWRGRAALNATGAVLTALAAVVFMASKFTEGAWALLVIIPVLIAGFDRVENYYADVGRQLGLGELPPRPASPGRQPAVVVVPVLDVSRRTALALSTAQRLGSSVHAVAVGIDPSATKSLCGQWRTWDPGIELTVLPSPHRTLVAPIVGYVQTLIGDGHDVTVLLSEVEPRHRRHELLHNQRGMVLAAALRSRTDAVVATVPFRLE